MSALFALPLQLGAINVGVLDLYRRSPGPLGGAELRDVLAAVEDATLLLLQAQVRADTEALEDTPSGSGRPASGQVGDVGRWDGRSDDRAEVHQATGMVLIQLGVPIGDALVRLRAYAFANQRLLSDVAHDVVARRLVFTQHME